MNELSGQLGTQSIIEIIRTVYLERRTGVLEIEHQDNRKRFEFVGGDLHLDGSHPLAQALAQFLDAKRRHPGPPGDEASKAKDVPRGSGLSGDAIRELQSLVERIVAMMVKIEEGSFRFVEDPEELSLNLVGPLPTAYLVMEGAVYNLNEIQLLRRLGGDQALLIADHSLDRLNGLYEIEPEEMFLLSRAEAPITVATLLRQLSHDRRDALRKLCRFQAIDLIRPAEVEPEPPDVEEGPDESDLGQEVVDRFLQRMRLRLETDPVKLDTREHRQLLADLMRRVGGMSHYDLLGVDFHASSDEIHAAYDRLARRLHPDHAASLDLAGKEGAIHVLFERATEAYLTLTDPERRLQYNSQAGIEAEDAEKVANMRRRTDEQKDVARSHYERARDLVEAEDYHFGLELVRQAVRLDPQAEYYALSGEIQARNPHWLSNATESYRHALKLQPNNTEYRLALAGLLERTGQLAWARNQYRTVLQRVPDHAEALEAVKRLGQPEAPVQVSEKRGFFGRVRRLWGG